MAAFSMRRPIGPPIEKGWQLGETVSVAFNGVVVATKGIAHNTNCNLCVQDRVAHGTINLHQATT